MLHHLGEQASAAVRRLHGDDGDGGSRNRSTRNRQPPAVGAAGGDPSPVDLETEAPLWFKHLAMWLPFGFHVVVVEAAYHRREEFVEPLGRHIHQITLGQMRRGRTRCHRSAITRASLPDAAVTPHVAGSRQGFPVRPYGSPCTIDHETF